MKYFGPGLGLLLGVVNSPPDGNLMESVQEPRNNLNSNINISMFSIFKKNEKTNERIKRGRNKWQSMGDGGNQNNHKAQKKKSLAISFIRHPTLNIII